MIADEEEYNSAEEMDSPPLVGGEDAEGAEEAPVPAKGMKKRNQVGTGSVTFAPSEIKTIDGIVTCILKITNSSMMVISKKIEILKHTEMRDSDLARRSSDPNAATDYEIDDEISEENKRFINDIKKEYILKNLMKTISMVPDLKNKCCCIIYLMKKGAHISYKDYFKLVPVETEYEYINQNNEWINAVIDDIFQDVFKNTQELEDVMAKFKASISPEISEFINERYNDATLVTLKSGTLYRSLNRHFGENVTKEDKQIIGKFLSDYKQIKTRSIVRDLPYYLEKFKLTQSDWTVRMRDLKALKEINKISAFDWLNIY